MYQQDFQPPEEHGRIRLAHAELQTIRDDNQLADRHDTNGRLAQLGDFIRTKVIEELGLSVTKAAKRRTAQQEAVQRVPVAQARWL